MTWLTGWVYRKSHLITAATGAGANYQVMIKVYKTTGTDGTETINGITAGKVYVGTHCRDDFGDIRFTDDDGNTELKHWIETLVSGTSAVFWVKVTDSLESVNQTIYIYYDKSDATNNDDMTNTFIFGDDFSSGSTPDTNKWSITGSPTISGGICTVPAGAQIVGKVNVGPYGVCHHWRAKYDSEGSNAVSIQGLADAAQYNAIYIYVGGSKYRRTIKNGASTLAVITWGSGVYYVGDQFWNSSTSAKFARDGNDLGTNSTNVPATAIPVLFYSRLTYGPNTLVDYTFVRKYISPEPAHSTWGIEEAGYKTVTYDIDVLLKKLGIPKTNSIDFILIGGTLKTDQIDVILLKYGVTKTDSIDILFKKLGLTKTEQIDVCVALRLTSTDNIDVLFKRLNIIVNQTWAWKKSVTINYAANAGTNYQVAIKVYFGSGTDGTETLGATKYGAIAGKVYVGGKCRPDFGDIRFKGSDGVTDLDYYLAEKVNSSYAIFWVEVKEDLSSTNRIIWIWYGNYSATTTSNGNNTFLFFEDWSGGLSKWEGDTGSASISNGVMTFTALAGSITKHMRVKTSFNGNVRAYATVAFTSWINATYPTESAGFFKSTYGAYIRNANWYYSSDGNKYWITEYFDLGGYTAPSMGSSTNYHDDKMDWKNIAGSEYASGICGSTTQTNIIPEPPLYYAFSATSGPSDAAILKCTIVYIRKWVSPAPTFGSWTVQVRTTGGYNMDSLFVKVFPRTDLIDITFKKLEITTSASIDTCIISIAPITIGRITVVKDEILKIVAGVDPQLYPQNIHVRGDWKTAVYYLEDNYPVVLLKLGNGTIPERIYGRILPKEERGHYVSYAFTLHVWAEKEYQLFEGTGDEVVAQAKPASVLADKIIGTLKMYNGDGVSGICYFEQLSSRESEPERGPQRLTRIIITGFAIVKRPLFGKPLT